MIVRRVLDDRSAELTGSAAVAWILAERPVSAREIVADAGPVDAGGADADATAVLHELEAAGWVTRCES